jgi:hypothetical protein
VSASFFTVLCAQTQTKQIFESIASQCFQKFACGSFARKLLYIAMKEIARTNQNPNK